MDIAERWRKLREERGNIPKRWQDLKVQESWGVVVSGVQPEKGWAFIANAEQKTGLGVIAGDPDKSMLLSIDVGKSLMEILIQSKIQLQPMESCKLEDYIVLTNEDYEPMDKLSNMLRKAA